MYSFVERVVRSRKRAVKTCADALAFAREQLEFEPDEQQARVLSGGAQRLLLNCSRQWGKSTITAVKAVYEAWRRPESLILVVSPSARQSGEFLRKASGFVRKLGLRARGDGDNAMSLLLPNGSRLVGLPGAEATVRGFSAVSLLIVEEAARVSDEQYKALRPVLAVSGGGLWLVSTPWGKRGFFYEEWVHGGPEWERVRTPATECARIPAAYLEEERRVHGEQWFRQEYLCEFADVEGALFDRDQLMGLVDENLEGLKV